MSAVVTGILFAYHFAKTGGVWDNVKKLVERF